MNILPSITSENFLEEEIQGKETKELFLEMLRLNQIAEKEYITFYVSSGFVLDLAYGKLLRAHGDLDLLVLAENFEQFKLLLEQEGYIMKFFESKNPKAAFKADKDWMHLDVGAITINGTKIIDITDGDDTPYTWPSIQTEPIWQRNIDNILVSFMSPEFILYFKTAANRERDRKDVIELRALLSQ